MLGRNSDFIYIDEITTNYGINNVNSHYTLGESPETTFEITLKGNPDISKFKNLFFVNGWHDDSFDHAIEKIYVNEKKRTVVVIFANKFRIRNKDYDPANDSEWDKYKTTNKVIVKCNKEEVFDVYRAVSAACMIKSYGSNSAFKSHIRKTMGVYSDSLYVMIARYLTGVMFGRWEKFVKAVDEAKEVGE